MNRPSITRALPTSDRETLRMAFVALATQAVTISKLRAQVTERDARIAEKDEAIVELRAMLERAIT